MKRKLTALILAALCAATSAVCLTACNTATEATTPPPAGSEEEEPKEEEKPSEPELTFSDFIKDHKTDAVKFFEDYIYNSVVGEREVKAENWYLNDADGDDKVESASMCYIYGINETERSVEVATVTFTPIGVEDIVDGKVTSLQISVSRETKMTFDAKEEEKQTQAATLLSETVLNGALLKSTAYTLEKFEEEKPPVTTDPPEEEPVTNAEIIAALEEYCIDRVVSAAWIGGARQNKENIVDGTWYLTKDIDGNVTKAEYAYNYQLNSVDTYYVITEVNFALPLTFQNIKDGNVTVANCTNKYTNTASINHSIQAERADLANAICDKVFGENDNATRYIIDRNAGYNSTHLFTVIQIENGSVRETTIQVKEAANDVGYIANLNGETTTSGTKSYEVSGEKVIIEE